MRRHTYTQGMTYLITERGGSMWRTFLAWLAALSADPNSAIKEQPVADAACYAAYACQKIKAPPPAPPIPVPEPEPEPDDDDGNTECCGECQGTGKIKMPDGHVVECPCPKGCDCKKKQDEESDCPDGQCDVSPKQYLTPPPLFRRRILR